MVKVGQVYQSKHGTEFKVKILAVNLNEQFLEFSTLEEHPEYYYDGIDLFTKSMELDILETFIHKVQEHGNNTKK